MKTRICMMVAMTFLLGNSVALADRVYLYGGGNDYESGKVSSISPTEVTLAGKPPIPVNTIRYVKFDKESKVLSSARNSVLAGKYTSALKKLTKDLSATIKEPEGRVDFAFYKAYAYAQYALRSPASKQEKRLNSAAKQLNSFVSGSGKNSYHKFEAQEMLGDVALAIAKKKNDGKLFAKAKQQYAAVANAAPWPGTKLRMNMKTAQALVAEGNSNEAASIYQQIVDSDVDDEQSAAYKDQARLGLANAMAAGGRVDQALAMVNKVILNTPAEEQDVMANAYMVMARCARAGGKSKEELMALLRIDLLYNQDSDLHAEALSRLAVLWTDENKPKRAAEAKLTLRSRYPNSPWLNR